MIYALISSIGLIVYELKSRGLGLKRSIIYAVISVPLLGGLLASLFNQAVGLGIWSFLIFRLAAIIGLLIFYRKTKRLREAVVAGGLTFLSPSFVQLVNSIFGG